MTKNTILITMRLLNNNKMDYHLDKSDFLDDDNIEYIEQSKEDYLTHNNQDK